MATPLTPPVALDPRNAHIASGKRDVQITASQVQPPTPLYVQPEDSFQLTILNPVLIYASPLRLLMRWLRPDGEIVSICKFLPPVLGQTVLTFTLGEGFLLSATVTPPDNSIPEPGGTFAILTVQRDTPETRMLHMVLFSDYLCTSHYPTWPYGRQIFPQDGPGRLRSIVGTIPAAGAEISELVPFNTSWNLLSIMYSLTTSAVAGNRQTELSFDDGASTYCRMVPQQAMAASTLHTITWAADCASFYDGVRYGTTNLPVPCPLNGNFHIRTNTVNLDVADQYTAPTYLVREWISE